jgi:hypothetical protein
VYVRQVIMYIRGGQPCYALRVKVGRELILQQVAISNFLLSYGATCKITNIICKEQK